MRVSLLAAVDLYFFAGLCASSLSRSVLSLSRAFSLCMGVCLSFLLFCLPFCVRLSVSLNYKNIHMPHTHPPHSHTHLTAAPRAAQLAGPMAMLYDHPSSGAHTPLVVDAVCPKGHRTGPSQPTLVAWPVGELKR